MTTRRTLGPRALAAVGIGAALLLSACAPAASNDTGEEAPAEAQTIEVGFSAPYTGPNASFGPSIESGINAGFADFAAEGSKLNLQIQDDGCVPEQAASVVQGLLDSDVSVVFGPACSGALAATQQMMATAEMPHISGGYQATLTETGDAFFLRTVPNDTQLTRAVSEYIAEEGHKTVAVVHDSTSYGTSGAAQFDKNAQAAGLEIVYEGEYQFGSTDFSGQAVRLRDSNPDAIYLQGYEADLGQLVREIRKLGMEQPIFGPTIMGNPEFAEAAGEAAEGVVFASNYISTNPATKEIAAKFEKEFGAPMTDVAAAGYLGGVAIAEAFKTLPSSARGQEVLDALRAVKIDTPFGHLAFDKSGNLVDPPVLLGTVKGGTAVLVKDVSGTHSND